MSISRTKLLKLETKHSLISKHFMQLWWGNLPFRRKKPQSRTETQMLSNFNKNNYRSSTSVYSIYKQRRTMNINKPTSNMFHLLLEIFPSFRAKSLSTDCMDKDLWLVLSPFWLYWISFEIKTLLFSAKSCFMSPPWFWVWYCSGRGIPPLWLLAWGLFLIYKHSLEYIGIM